MPELYYRDAMKQGLKAYHACVAAGEYPYLPVLDEILPSERSAAGQNQGLISIPAEFITGTKTRGRTNAFARNFMPLMKEGTEFSQKWERLCHSHLTEGIRDPIKAYEYLNRYYVEEGNKRVSVLKYFGAVTVYAQVTRIMPENMDTEESRRYLEYLDFYRVSGINYIELSGKGGYDRLQKLTGKNRGEKWTDDDRNHFSSAYHSFSQAYKDVCGTRITIPMADAMLSYLEIYGYPSIFEKSRATLHDEITGMWEEIRLHTEESPIELKTEPVDERKRGLLSRVILSNQTVRVAFIYDKTPADSAWAKEHEAGRLAVQEKMGGRVETRAYGNAMLSGGRETIEKAMEDGCKVVFATSPRLLHASLQAAVEHPEAAVFTCALNQSHRYIRAYYPRIFEAKFLVGAIAGAMAEEEKIGYICDYPIYGQVAGINAFALGAQTVNPRIKVVLEWSAVAGIQEARKRLRDRGIRLISDLDMTLQDEGGHAQGLTVYEENGIRKLAAPLWKWDVYYEKMLRRLLDNTAREEYEVSSKALNYYWGMAAGVADIWCSEEVPAGVRKLVSILKDSICRESFNPFNIPLYDQAGSKVKGDQNSLTPEQIMNMDWLVENIEGSIPKFEELQPYSKVTVSIMGVDSSLDPKH